MLLLTTIFQVRFGLAPLKRISDAIADIRSGRAERLEGEFPVEIAPLARETNALIDANREIVERARTHVGNLAHAIKTPLSVIVNEASAHAADPFATKVLEQADVMRDQVAHHLERARIAARLTIIGTVTEVGPRSRRCAGRWRRSIATAASPSRSRPMRRRSFAASGRTSRRWPATSSTTPANGRPRGSSIEVHAWSSRGRPAPAPMLRIIVDDDGRGLSAAERAQVSRRGQRLDESKPGSGLGLSIVVDLAALYGGSLSLGNAPIGGTAGRTGAAGGIEASPVMQLEIDIWPESLLCVWSS